MQIAAMAMPLIMLTYGVNDLMRDDICGLNFDHRSRHRKVSYPAIHALAAKRDLSSLENSLPSCRTFIDHLQRVRRRFQILVN